MSEMIPAREVRPGDVIHAESPRYHGPTFTVDTVDLTVWVPDTYRIVGHYGSEGQHPATLAAVPGGKEYRVDARRGCLRMWRGVRPLCALSDGRALWSAVGPAVIGLAVIIAAFLLFLWATA